MDGREGYWYRLHIQHYCKNDELNSLAKSIPAILVTSSTKNIKRRTELQEELKESLHITTGLAHNNTRCILEVSNDI